MSSRIKKIPTIIDTDPGVDDILAILLALASPELDVRAIIITFGNTDVDPAYLNILKLYQAIDRHIKTYPESCTRFPGFSSDKKIILAKGATGPLDGELHSAKYFHGLDGLSNITERHPDLNVDTTDLVSHPQLELTNRTGVEVARDVLESVPDRTLSYVVLGPMTTLAHFSREHGDLLHRKIGRIISMGGNLDVPGNTTPVAEFNYYADPYAVKELLNPLPGMRGLPLSRFLLLPLDITTPHELPFPYYQSRIDPAFENTSRPSDPLNKPPIVHFTSSALERAREVMISFGKDVMELHDIVAVWCAAQNPPEEGDLDPHALPKLDGEWAAEKRWFEIERFGELTRGMLVVDRRDGQTAHGPGTNRSQGPGEHNEQQHGLEPSFVPAQVEIEQPPVENKHPPGVTVITATPGPAALLQLLSQRVWGVSSN